ncbi:MULTISPECIES: hypothetical protein [unclassified Pseudomonas]|jgi:hypothetical protein|uniref:hypothetical protein n=1 Tax=unclassified Pseudomonas TaxID=196821 RepID=UPI0003432385|nr:MULTISPECIES: hypothetical protein [unclassified Pseudomonas]EPA96800.1 hypothetical protein PG5_27290 [Pseudomonas sp. G5(2012)]PMZ89819.1 hypothetical protein C1X61_10240 [Pseudomonas sp. FW215-T2]PNA15779.1 hypothetical protein C1X62_03805 [Pseudomonas sp. FW215-R3]PNB37807.1 hypothetical protein C1X63_11505 [Pseudomonas sp. FW305-131]
MSGLSSSVENRLSKFQPPVDHKEFERLCVDVFEFILKARNIKILSKLHNRVHAYGTTGDKQYGVDVRDPATMAVAQCKRQVDITTTTLQRELKLLMEYEKDVSHYFFLISHSDVKKSLSDWVEKKNTKAKAERDDSTPFPCLPSVALPELHILGWDEIRSYLGQSTFLLWKWQVSIPVGQNFHLDGLDINGLDREVRRFKDEIDPAETPLSQEAIDAIESLLSTIDIERILTIGAGPLIDVKVVNGIGTFINELAETYRVIRTYPEAIRKIDKRDLIVVEQGYSLLNDLARQKARISAYPYLRRILFACQALRWCLTRPECYMWEPEEVIDECGDQHVVDGVTQLRFNFTKKESTYYGIAYTDPKEVIKLTGKIVKGIRYLTSFS